MSCLTVITPVKSPIRDEPFVATHSPYSARVMSCDGATIAITSFASV